MSSLAPLFESDHFLSSPSYVAMRNGVTSHRSIRKFVQVTDGQGGSIPKPIPNEILSDILQTGMRSSNNGNMQTYSVIVTTDQQRRDQLSLIHDNDKIAKAPVFLTFVADWTLMKEWCKERNAFGKDPTCYSNSMAFWTSALDVMVYAQTVVSLAEAGGLGICFHGSTIWETDRLNKFFGLPEGAHVVTSVSMGWPDEAPAARARLDGFLHIHREKFGVAFVGEQPEDHLVAASKEVETVSKRRKITQAGDSIRGDPKMTLQHYQSRETEGWNRYIQLYGPEKWQAKIDAHKLENLAQVYTVLKYSGKDYRKWTNGFIESLRTQGFGENARILPFDDSEVSHCLDPGRFKGNKLGLNEEGYEIQTFSSTGLKGR